MLGRARSDFVYCRGRGGAAREVEPGVVGGVKWGVYAVVGVW